MVLLFVRSGPECVGQPSVRRRFLGALLNKATVIWVGPRGEDMERDLMSRFWKSIQLPGSRLLIDSDEARWTCYEHLTIFRFVH